MSAQNNIELQRLHVPDFSSPRFIPTFFSICIPCSRLFLHNLAKTIFAKRAPAKREKEVRIHYLYFFILRTSLRTRCARYRRAPSVRLRFSRIFIFHFNLHFNRSTHVHEKARTLVRNSYSRYTRPGGGNLHLPVDGWMALVRRNYLVVITTGPPSNDTPASGDAILKIFSKI